MTTFKKFGLLLVLAALAAAGPARADAPKVVVGIKPIHSLVTILMDGVGTPELLVQGDTVPWEYELSHDRAKALAEADLIVAVGPEMEGFLGEAMPMLTRKTMVLTLLSHPQLKVLPIRGGDGVQRDPYLWLDSRNGLALVRLLSKVLAEIDPANRDAYDANRLRAMSEVSRIDRKFEYDFRKVSRGPVVAYHDTQQYFEQAYALRVLAAVSSRPGGAPDAGRLLMARGQLQRGTALCVLTEKSMAAPNLSVLTEGLKVPVAELDSLGVGLEPGPGLYVTLMEKNFEAIRACMDQAGAK